MIPPHLKGVSTLPCEIRGIFLTVAGGPIFRATLYKLFCVCTCCVLQAFVTQLHFVPVVMYALVAPIHG